MTWISPGKWTPIGQYRTAPLPITPIPPLPKPGSSTRLVLKLIADKKSRSK
uniref:Uncharacterized protein n=1 Tax=viral metagenome TaxID=1070528 RepID=A0A6C0ANX9_9ZZZZ